MLKQVQAEQRVDNAALLAARGLHVLPDPGNSFTLHPTPYTLNPKPQIPNPKP